MKLNKTIILGLGIAAMGAVVVVIALLPGLGSHPSGPRRQTALTLSAFQLALNDFKSDCGAFPNESQGLNALLANPGNTNWQGPYIEGVNVGIDSKDGWGTLLRYRSTQAGPVIVSAGEDRTFGTQDDISVSNQVPHAIAGRPDSA